jgi:Icc-related predicted phosphoesterase
MKSKNQHLSRVLTVADLHQSRALYASLAEAVEEHKPDLVAVVGDALDTLEFSEQRQFTVAECAQRLAALPSQEVIFVRGNHEDTNWSEFVAAWPHQKRELSALYGSAMSFGPLVVVGFPCMLGNEFTWTQHLRNASNQMELCPARCRNELPSDPEEWLPNLIHHVGQAGRTLWLMHESPIALPLADPSSFNPAWRTALELYSPRLIVSGHDHRTPLMQNRWNARLGNSFCVNAGQSNSKLHYTVIDFEFPEASPCLPLEITVRAFPWGEELLI